MNKKYGTVLFSTLAHIILSVAADNGIKVIKQKVLDITPETLMKINRLGVNGTAVLTIKAGVPTGSDGDNENVFNSVKEYQCTVAELRQHFIERMKGVLEVGKKSKYPQSKEPKKQQGYSATIVGVTGLGCGAIGIVATLAVVKSGFLNEVLGLTKQQTSTWWPF